MEDYEEYTEQPILLHACKEEFQDMNQIQGYPTTTNNQAQRVSLNNKSSICTTVLKYAYHVSIISWFSLGLHWFVCVGCILGSLLQSNFQFVPKKKKYGYHEKLAAILPSTRLENAIGRDILIHEHLLWMKSGYDVGESTNTQVKVDQSKTMTCLSYTVRSFGRTCTREHGFVNNKLNALFGFSLFVK